MASLSDFGKMVYEPKGLGHFWLAYIRMLGHLHMNAHSMNFDRL